MEALDCVIEVQGALYTSTTPIARRELVDSVDTSGFLLDGLLIAGPVSIGSKELQHKNWLRLLASGVVQILSEELLLE